MAQPALAEHCLAVKEKTVRHDPRVRSSSAGKLLIRSSPPMPVVVDSTVVDSNPAWFRVLSGAPHAIAGRGDALARPTAHALVSAVMNYNTATRPHPALVEVSAA
jgi:hypothetical protein